MTNVSRLAYGIAAWAAFHEPFLSFVDFLEKHTKQEVKRELIEVAAICDAIFDDQFREEL